MTEEVIASEVVTDEVKDIGKIAPKYPPSEKLTEEKLKRLEELDHSVLIMKASLYDYFERLGTTQIDINNTKKVLDGLTKEREGNHSR